MNDAQLLELVAETDAYAPHTPLPVSTWSREDALHEIERRMGMDTRDSTKNQTPLDVTHELEPTTGSKAPERIDKVTARRKWSGAFVGAAAFAVIVVIGVVIAVVTSIGDGSESLPPAEEQTFTTDDALAVVDAFVNADDADAVVALFSPDVTIEDNFSGEWNRADWEMVLAWNFAQGTTLTSPDCTVTDEVPGEAVTVTCEYGIHNAPSQAVGAPPVPTMDTIVVTPDGIRLLASVYGQPDFEHSTIPFERWVQNNRPEDADKVGFGNWTSVEEAEQNGLLTARYAQEWAAFLDAKGCVYPDSCYRLP